MKVTVIVVTHNHERWLPRCLDAAQEQAGEVIVVDSASTDGTVAAARACGVRVLELDGNRGYTAGQNAGMAAASGDAVLALGPDVFLEPGFVDRLVPALRGDHGLATGCLLRASAEEGTATGALDSTGLFFLPSRRHVDRGAGEPDDGRYGEAGEVFGATGAALLMRRDVLLDVTPPGHRGPFDEAFWSYREDADLAWRAQLLGWRCWYEPRARALHVRSLRPDQRRRHVHPLVNMHSVKNRYLMLVKNETWAGLRPDLASLLAREAAIAGGVVLSEWSSLPAYRLLWSALPQARRDRSWIQGRRRVDPQVVRERMLLPG